jgi:hypothetical protein
MKNKNDTDRDELRPEYDFDYSKAVRGKYFRRVSEEGTNVVVLDPDVARTFRDSASVNEALRSLLDFTRTTRRITTRSKGLADSMHGSSEHEG